MALFFSSTLAGKMGGAHHGDHRSAIRQVDWHPFAEGKQERSSAMWIALRQSDAMKVASIQEDAPGVCR